MEEFQISLFAIILILAFYLPGYFFRRFYFSGFSTKQLGFGEWYDRFFTSIFWGIIIQFLFTKLLHDKFGYDFKNIRFPINQVYIDVVNKKLPELNYSNFQRGIIYLASSMGFASIMGIIIRNIIRVTKLDLYISIFRFANIWHYYFRGEITKLNDFKSINRKGKWVSTRADILIDNEKEGKNLLYNGIISQYDISTSSDKLERIYLTKTKRYSNNDSSGKIAGFKDVPGDIFIIENSRILNINLSYDFLSIEKGQKKKLLISFVYIISILALFSPFIIVPYFFYNKVPLWRILFSIFFSFLELLMVYSFFTMLFTNTKEFKEKYHNSSKYQALIWAFVFLILIFFILKILLFP